MKIGDFIKGVTPAHEKINGEIVEIKKGSNYTYAWILLDDGFKVVCFFDNMELDVKKMRDTKLKNIIK